MKVIYIALGGAFGTILRYFVTIQMAQLLGPAFPYGTLVVNVVGSYLIGLINYMGLNTAIISDTVRLTLTTGIMGGLTTYSTFNYETLEYLRSRSWNMAFTNVLVTGVLCLIAGMLGLATGQRIAAR